MIFNFSSRDPLLSFPAVFCILLVSYRKGAIRMFKNPGGKIKKLAKLIFAIELILFIIGGLVMIAFGLFMVSDSDPASVALIIGGILTILIGIISAWLSVLAMFAYGSMVEDVEEIRNHLIERG